MHKQVPKLRTPVLFCRVRMCVLQYLEAECIWYTQNTLSLYLALSTSFFLWLGFCSIWFPHQIFSWIPANLLSIVAKRETQLLGIGETLWGVVWDSEFNESNFMSSYNTISGHAEVNKMSSGEEAILDSQLLSFPEDIRKSYHNPVDPQYTVMKTYTMRNWPQTCMIVSVLGKGRSKNGKYTSN